MLLTIVLGIYTRKTKAILQNLRRITIKRILKSKLAIVLVLMLILSAVAGCADTKPEPTGSATTPEITAEATSEGTTKSTEAAAMKMVMITDAGGLGDKGFNDLIWMGMQRAEAELGYEIAVIELNEAAQYGPNTAAAAEQGYDVVICVGFLFVDMFGEVAPQYPDTNFVMIDANVTGCRARRF